LEYRAGFYLKLALAACLAAVLVFATHVPAMRQAYGATALGYTLCTIAAVLVLWLMALGLRKRRYRSRLGTVQGWTSAHVYLGASLLSSRRSTRASSSAGMCTRPPTSSCCS